MLQAGMGNATQYSASQSTGGQVLQADMLIHPGSAAVEDG